MHRPDISHDELRRRLRTMNARSARDTAAMTNTMEALFEAPVASEQRVAALIGRRRFLVIGGLSVATASVLAACAETASSGIARVGVAPTTTALPKAVINDIVLLRTASSLEHSAIAVYDLVIGNADLLDPALRPVAERFRDDHRGHAALFEKLTADLGGVPWTCGNPRIDETLITPVVRAIAGGPATDLLIASPPSDDPRRDVLSFAHGLESLAGSTYQSLVPALSQPSLRAETITVGTHEVRHAALLAILITGRPDGYVDPGDVQNATQTAPTSTAAPTTTQNIGARGTDPAGEGAVPAATPIPPVYAMPAQFGRLAGADVVLGAPNDAGARSTFKLDTPSLNTFVYEYMTPECG